MEKRVLCTNCKQAIEVAGPTHSEKEIPHEVTCPNCEEPNEVLWPIGAGYVVVP
jgi:hypothetical protein